MSGTKPQNTITKDEIAIVLIKLFLLLKLLPYDEK
tara:strand:+ start:364 stop:468 length:105 start_codon:yes stop_codon:yes gene_type:complete